MHFWVGGKDASKKASVSNLTGENEGGKGLRERQREERRDKMMSVRLAVVLFTRLQNP